MDFRTNHRKEFNASSPDVYRRMILFAASLIIINSLALTNTLHHIVIRLDGTSEVGIIDSMNSESVFITPMDSQGPKTHPLEEIYYIYGTNGKLFYISPNYLDRLNLIEERSGFLVTITEDTLHYTSILVDRKMDTPYFYLSSDEKDLAHKISLFDIHLVRIDESYIEHSVRRGSWTGTGLLMLGVLLQSFSDYGTRRKSLPDDPTFMNKVNAFGGSVGTTITNFVPGGNQYQAVTIFYPISTIGWMVYDYKNDKRTHYFRPLIRDDQFPQNMFWLNPKRIMKERLARTLDPIRDIWPF